MQRPVLIGRGFEHVRQSAHGHLVSPAGRVAPDCLAVDDLYLAAELLGQVPPDLFGDRLGLKIPPSGPVIDRRHRTSCARTVPIELAGHSPGWPAAPDGPGLPGRLPWSGEAGRSWCRVAAGGLVGWRASWVRTWLPGWSGVAPGLAVPPPPGRCGSLSRGAWPGGRARVARSPALPRGARSSSGGAPAAGRASARPPTGRCRRDRRRSPTGPALAAIWASRSRNLPVGMPETSRRKARAAPAARGAAPVAFASLGAGRGEVEVLDHDGPGAVLPRGGDEGADGGPQPPVPGGGGQPGQVQRRP